MVNKFTAIFWLILLNIIGCATQRPNNYDQVWNATQQVLARHNLQVQESLYREGTMIAVSQVNGDFLSKTRVKVIARVVEDEEGYAEPSIRVINQYDNADVQAWGHAHYQTGSQWINLSSNPAMEARLYNEIQVLLGKNNRYKGKAWQPPYNESNSYGRASENLPKDEFSQQEMSLRPVEVPYEK